MDNIILLNRDIENKLYIQGSSIKGALVNLLLVDYIINNENEFLNEKNEILKIVKKSSDKLDYQNTKKLKEIIKNIEDKVLYVTKGDKKKTKYFGISISDSYKCYSENVNFYQDIDEKLEESNKKSYLPVVREYIEPKSKFEFDIIIDFELLSNSKLKINSYNDLIFSLENAIEYLIMETLNVYDTTKKENLILGANTRDAEVVNAIK